MVQVADTPLRLQTGIGLLSLLIAHLESNPHPTHLTRENPFYSTLTCAAADDATTLSSLLRKAVQKSQRCDKALKKLETLLVKDPSYRALMGTTQAVDLISGGLKVNVRLLVSVLFMSFLLSQKSIFQALPETASAVINHRINVASSVKELQERITQVIEPKAVELNLTLTSFGEDIVRGKGLGHVDLEEAFQSWFVLFHLD